MGCCFSCDQDKDTQDGRTPSESQGLLNDYPANNEGAARPTTSGSYDAPQQKGDEQSALNRILQQAANEVIDVAALDVHLIEQQEYMDRVKHYNSRVALMCANKPRPYTFRPLPIGVAAPQVILAAQPISLADIQLISSATAQASKLVQEIKVKHKEDLVVPFGVP